MISMVTGAISNTVVTLSSSPEATAVTSDIISIIFIGSPPDIFAVLTAIHWKRPVLAVILMIIIMPSSRKMTL